MKTIPTLSRIHTINSLIFAILLTTAFTDLAAETHASYLVSIDADHPRYATVTAQLNPQQGRIYLNDSAADTGLYHGWATFLQSIKATDLEGNPLEVVYLTNGSWRVSPPVDQQISLEYEMLLQHDRFPNDPGDDELAYAQPWGVMWTGRALFITGTPADQIEVTFDVADNWGITTPWHRVAAGSNTFSISGNEQLLDAAFMTGTHYEHEFMLEDATIRLGLGGESVQPQADVFQSILHRYLDAYTDLFGGPPHSNMALLASEGRLLGGGVMGSTISMLFGQQLAGEMLPMVHYITTHEMYHLWNANLHYANHPELYWFIEGFAEYITFLTALRNGDLDEHTFLSQLAERWQLYSNVSGTLSLAAAGDDKLDNYDLIYSGGMLAALTLDAMIMEQSRCRFSLDTLHRYIYRHYQPGSDAGLNNHQLAEAIQQSTGVDAEGFFDRYISGSEPLPIDTALQTLGLTFSQSGSDDAPVISFIDNRDEDRIDVWNKLMGNGEP